MTSSSDIKKAKGTSNMSREMSRLVSIVKRSLVGTSIAAAKKSDEYAPHDTGKLKSSLVAGAVKSLGNVYTVGFGYGVDYAVKLKSDQWDNKRVVRREKWLVNPSSSKTGEGAIYGIGDYMMIGVQHLMGNYASDAIAAVKSGTVKGSYRSTSVWRNKTGSARGDEDANS